MPKIVCASRTCERWFHMTSVSTDNYNCRRSGNGGPQTCLPAACGVAQRGAQHSPSSPTQTQDPREGPSLAGRTTQSFLRHGLIRLAREEAERSRRGTSRGARDEAMTTGGARRVPARAASSFPLWCKGRKRSRRVPRHQAKVAISVQRDQRLGGLRDGGHRGAQDGVITRALRRRRLPLSG